MNKEIINPTTANNVDQWVANYPILKKLIAITQFFQRHFAIRKSALVALAILVLFVAATSSFASLGASINAIVWLGIVGIVLAIAITLNLLMRMGSR